MQYAPWGGEKKFDILIVDDVPENLGMISDMLSDQYHCRAAINGEKALTIAWGGNPPDLVLLDIAMPGMDGYEVCRHLKNDPRTRETPVIFLTALDGEEDEAKGFQTGGVDYITKPVSRAVLLARVEAQLTLLRGKRFLEQRNEILESTVRERSRQLRAMQDVVIMAMASLAETRDSDTSAHIRRVQHFTRELALALRENPHFCDHLDDNAPELLFKTCPLHDIGKVGVPDSILFKPGRLSEDEFAAMKQHSFFGGQTLREVERQLVVPAAFVTMAREIALHHHERWDGSGYPLGLRGEEIPLSARIVALADTYDALTGVRLYKFPCLADDARAIIERERGRQFDPAVVDAFLSRTEAFRKISEDFPDSARERARSETFRRFIADSAIREDDRQGNTSVLP
jgi:putative two-component system response regulator